MFYGESDTSFLGSTRRLLFPGGALTTRLLALTISLADGEFLPVATPGLLFTSTCGHLLKDTLDEATALLAGVPRSPFGTTWFRSPRSLTLIAFVLRRFRQIRKYIFFIPRP